MRTVRAFIILCGDTGWSEPLIFQYLLCRLFSSIYSLQVADKIVTLPVRTSRFSREATISRLDLSYFSICILGYSQNRLISFDSRRINEARSQYLIHWSKLNHIPHIKRFEILVYKLTDNNFIHFVGCKLKF